MAFRVRPEKPVAGTPAGEPERRRRVASHRASPPPWWRRKPVTWASSKIIAPSVVVALTSLISGGLLFAWHHAPGIVPRKAAALPFRWTVAKSANLLNTCAMWSFPQPLSKIPLRNFHGYQNAAADELWALRHGGTDVSAAAYTVTFQGSGSADVTIQDVRVKILGRRRVPEGTRIGNGWGCGSAIPVRYFAVQINGPSLQLVREDGSRGWPYAISNNKPEVLCLGASLGLTPVPYEYFWVYAVDWAQGSRLGTVYIYAPNHKPFVLDPLGDGRAYFSDTGKWATS